MKECMERKTGIPQWYVIVDGQRNIIAGAGVIENDFHDRKDLTPNLCALFVEERKRGRGIAGVVLDFVRKDLASLGYSRLYLVTDLSGFYERYGWNFLTMVMGRTSCSGEALPGSRHQGRFRLTDSQPHSARKEEQGMEKVPRQKGKRGK